MAAFEEKVKLWQYLEAINPALKPFFRGKEATLRPVSYDKSGNSSSLAEEFDFIIEREVLLNICPYITKEDSPS